MYMICICICACFAIDVLSNRKMLQLLLQKKGMVCDMAVDGVDALEIVEKNPGKFDLIFMDNMMPNMTGVQCTRALRERKYPKIILGLTGNTMEDELFEFELQGADMVMAKPLRVQQLENLMKYFEANGTTTTIHDRSDVGDDGRREDCLFERLKKL
jgi:CheY-like chemotaxis protein